MNYFIYSIQSIVLKTCSLCKSVWTYHWYLVKRFSTCLIEYKPELFPCITLLYKNTIVRIFHTGKINLLGVKQVEQVSEIVEILSDAYFDYSLSCNFDNF